MAGLFGSVCLGQNSIAGTPARILPLEWQVVSDPTVTGYALYYGEIGGPLTNRVDVGLASSAVVRNLIAPTRYAFYVVSYNADGVESDPSNLFLYTAQAISSVNLSQLAGGSLAIFFDVAPRAACHVEYSDSLTAPSWKILSAATGDSNGVVSVVDPVVAPGGMRFYRAVVP